MTRSASSRVSALYASLLRRLGRIHGIPAWLAVPALLLAASMLLAQSRTLRLPLMDEHRWREADTYAVAYNFAHKSLDFFHPRTDVTHGRSGITGMEAPILGFVTALAMRVFGDDPMVGRVVVWLTGLAGLAASLALVRRIRDTGLAVGFLVAFSLSPLALFELRQFQPDGPTVMLAAVAAFFFYRFACTERRSDYVKGTLAFGLAVLVKGPGLVLAPAMWWFACAARRLSFRQLVLRGGGPVLAAGLYFPWDRWAHHLRSVYDPGKANFGIDFTMEGIKSSLQNQDRIHHIFWFIYPCYVSNWALFPALVVGLGAAFEPRTRRVSTAFLLWLLTSLFFLAAFSTRLKAHWYYASLTLIPAAYFAGYGLAEVFRLFARGSPPRSLVSRWAALVVLASLVVQRFMVPGSPKLADTVAGTAPHPEASWMSDGHLVLLVSLLAAMMIAAQAMSGWWLRVIALLMLPFAVWWGIGRARTDAIGAMLVRTHADEERDFRRRWLDLLRPAVNRFSTRDDLFVVNAPESSPFADDAFYMYPPLRRGWSERGKTLEKGELARYQRSGARFYLTFAKRPLAEEKTLELLSKTADFRLYCLDPKGCPPLVRPAR